MSRPESFQWQREPKAEQIIQSALDEYVAKSPFLAKFQEDLLIQTSTRLFDWLDYIAVEHSSMWEKELEDAGFVLEEAHPDFRVFYHPGAQLPRVALGEAHPRKGVAVKVECIAEFLMAHRLSGWIEGTPLSGFRRCAAVTEEGITLWAVERRGTRTLEPTYEEKGHAETYLECFEKWLSRPRALADEEEAFRRTLGLAEEITALVGRDMAAWIVLEGERVYWESRNSAGQLQKNRQDKLGMGWANHDHHTFRSSRKHFAQLVRLFEILGFHCRERFYAGEEAGWGAQVMENTTAGLVLFLDVDLNPEELAFNFAHQPLPQAKKLGTIGLWCGLHGDSILAAGMHHLEAQFLHDQLTEDLHHMGVRMMEPFSNFSYLKQAFTDGEHWNVDSRRVEALLREGFLSAGEAEKFRSYGAVGSHLENLQRREGYKGFNQKNVSFIIKKTDPRTLNQ